MFNLFDAFELILRDNSINLSSYTSKLFRYDFISNTSQVDYV